MITSSKLLFWLWLFSEIPVFAVIFGLKTIWSKVMVFLDHGTVFERVLIQIKSTELPQTHSDLSWIDLWKCFLLWQFCFNISCIRKLLCLYWYHGLHHLCKLHCFRLFHICHITYVIVPGFCYSFRDYVIVSGTAYMYTISTFYPLDLSAVYFDL